jgi:nicotinamide mononucleotide transporter
MELMTKVLAGFTAMSHWEYLAVLLSLTYVVLAIKEKMLCWPAAFFSTLIYTIIFFNGALLMESLLNVYYMAMAIIGYMVWKNGSRQLPLPIVSWRLIKHLKIIAITGGVAIIIGYFTDNHTHAELPYLDSLTTCFAVMATYLLARKVMENWLYWIVIDVASIYIYFVKGYYPTLILFVVYTFMAMWGYVRWHNESQQTREKLIAAT